MSCGRRRHRVPLSLEDITTTWVQRVLKERGVHEEVTDLRVTWLDQGSESAGGSTGSKLYSVVASLQDARELKLVCKIFSTDFYGKIPWTHRALLALFASRMHEKLVAMHNLGYTELEYYESFVLQGKTLPTLPTAKVFVTESTGIRAAKLPRLSVGWFTCATCILMEDLVAQGYHGFTAFESVDSEITHAALVDLAHFHAGHWGKSYVAKKSLPLAESLWFTEGLLENKSLCDHLLAGAKAGQGGLLKEFLRARDANLLITCNVPRANDHSKLFEGGPNSAQQILPELFESDTGPFMSALAKLETGMQPIIQRMKRVSKRRETLLMGDAHSGNIFVQRISSVSGVQVALRWIDFQHWGSGTVAMELAYLLAGMVDDPQQDAGLLQAYHEVLTSNGLKLDLGELRADVAAMTLGLVAAALLHYPKQWLLGDAIISCWAPNPTELTQEHVKEKTGEAEKGFRIVSRCIRRVPVILADMSNPLVQEMHAYSTADSKL